MTNLEKYEKILSDYRRGKYGDENLTLHTILERAGEPDLLYRLTVDELQILINEASGPYKGCLAQIRDKKNK